MAYTQDGRPLRIETALGKDALLLTSVVGEERLCRLFTFDVTLLSSDLEIAAETLIGTSVLIRIRRADGGDRLIHGRICEFRAGWTETEVLRRYSAKVVPWSWFLNQTTDCRIFQDMSAIDIAQKIFSEFGFMDFDVSAVTESHTVHTYVCQYQESYYDFLTRLFEDEGIHYHFRHEAKRHVMVLADSNAGFEECAETNLTCDLYNPKAGMVARWEHAYRFHPGNFSTADYNFENPRLPLRSDRRTLLPIPEMAKYETYAWPGDYYTRDDGDALVQHRLQEMEASYHTVEGESLCPAFSAGGRFKLATHPSKNERNRTYVLTSVRHEARDLSHLTGQSQGAFEYRNTFACFAPKSDLLEYDLQFRPTRAAPKPIIHGTQTAVVVGPSGETIWTDDFARVKVQFHWDRHGGKDDKASCWIRVSQAWAGENWGSLHIPHVGQEVIVTFLEGDPDRPLIIGRVYNGARKNPLVAEALGNKTKAITRDQGGNQTLTEGKDGEQAIRMSSPKANTNLHIGTKPSNFPNVSQVWPSHAFAMPSGAGSGGSTADTGTTSQAQAAQPKLASVQALFGRPASHQPGATATAAASSFQAQQGQVSDSQLSDYTDSKTGTAYTGLSQDTTANDDFNDGIYSWSGGDYVAYLESNNATTTVGDKYTVTLGNSWSYTKGNATKWTDGDAFSMTFGNNTTRQIGATMAVFYGAKFSYTVSAELAINVSLKATINMGMQMGVDMGGKFTLSTGMNWTLYSMAAGAALAGISAFGALASTYAVVASGSDSRAVDTDVAFGGALISGIGTAVGATIASELKLYPDSTIADFGLRKVSATMFDDCWGAKKNAFELFSTKLCATKDQADLTKTTIKAMESNIGANKCEMTGLTGAQQGLVAQCGALKTAMRGLTSM